MVKLLCSAAGPAGGPGGRGCAGRAGRAGAACAALHRWGGGGCGHGGPARHLLSGTVERRELSADWGEL